MGSRSFQICCSFLTWFGHDFSRDSFCLSTVSLSRQHYDILDFSYCPLSRVLHMTMAIGKDLDLSFI